MKEIEERRENMEPLLNKDYVHEILDNFVRIG